MTCEALKDQLIELSMGTLDASQRAQVLAHLQSGCAECNSFLALTRETIAALPLTLDPVQSRPEARDRLMQRVTGQSDPMRIGPSSTPSPRRFGILQALAGGAIAAGIVGAIFWHVSDDQKHAIASLQSQLDETRATIDQLKTNVQQAKSSADFAMENLQMMQSPAVQMVSLQGTDVQPKAKARAYYDPDKSLVRFYARDMAPAPASMAYELWLIDGKGNKIPAGTFAADKASAGVAMAVPTMAEQVVAFAVTREPATGSAQPTMPLVLLGKVQ